MKVAVVVDAFSSGSLFAPELSFRGYDVIHVRSQPQFSPSFEASFRRADFFLELTFNQSIDSLVSSLGKFRPEAVFAGAESGVCLADELSSRLGLLGNDLNFSQARRNKYLMIETVRKAGLRTADQIVSDRLSEIVLWAKTQTRFPVVLKPLNSAGTDGVFVCHDVEEVRHAFTEIYGRVNQLGLFNESVLAQSFLSGPEFIIDTVSSRGAHLVTDVWEYEKRTLNGRERVYDRIISRDSRLDEYPQMVDYFFGVLDALGIREGSAHGEIILTPEGPVLVEVGARPAGVCVPKLVKARGGYDQITAAIDAALDIAAFRLRLNEDCPRMTPAQIVFLISQKTGVLQRPLLMENIARLPSLAFSKAGVGVGSLLPLTVDCFTTPGLVFLKNEDEAMLEQDYRRLRSLEAAGFYDWSLAPHANRA